LGDKRNAVIADGRAQVLFSHEGAIFLEPPMVSRLAATRARALYDARRDRIPVAPFTDADPGLGMEDGYEIQQELVKLLLAEGDHVIGHKLGATSKAMQELIGIASPDYGPILQSTLYQDGDAVSVSRFISPKIEAEIVFILGDRLAGPGVTHAEALQSISAMAASMEIVDSRISEWRIRLADTIADLASNGALVVSGTRVPLHDVDPRSIKMVLRRNGQVIASGVGADALGDPVSALVWLANTLGRNGIALEAGHLVMTGALHAAVPMVAGDVFRAEFDHLGAVEVTVAE
jgi:2-keto-4-pentenoate hydratase